MGRLIIDRVNLKDLEEQRRYMNGVQWQVMLSDKIISQAEYDALTCIEAMLDAWSDEIWEKANVDSET